MNKPSILVAGATGVLGLPLVRRLVAGGNLVFGLTRSPERARVLEGLGCRPILGNVYEPEVLRRTLAEQEFSVVVHQLTDLPFGLPASAMDEGRRANARIRSEGTRNLLSALGKHRPGRLIAQSIAFCHGDAPGPFLESDPVEAPSIELYERLLQEDSPEVTILRYGPLFGPGTGVEARGPGAITADQAARVTCLAVESPVPGIFHVCGPGPYRTDKARKAWPGFDSLVATAIRE